MVREHGAHFCRRRVWQLRRRRRRTLSVGCCQQQLMYRRRTRSVTGVGRRRRQRISSGAQAAAQRLSFGSHSRCTCQISLHVAFKRTFSLMQLRSLPGLAGWHAAARPTGAGDGTGTFPRRQHGASRCACPCRRLSLLVAAHSARGWADGRLAAHRTGARAGAGGPLCSWIAVYAGRSAGERLEGGAGSAHGM